MDSQRQLHPKGPQTFGYSKDNWKRQNKHSEGGRSHSYDKSSRPFVGVSSSEDHGHGSSSHGQKRNLRPHEQKENILGLRLSRNCLRQNFGKGLRSALALIVVSRVISLRRLLSQSILDY